MLLIAVSTWRRRNNNEGWDESCLSLDGIIIKRWRLGCFMGKGVSKSTYLGSRALDSRL